MYEKKALKMIYKMRENNVPVREISRELKKRFKVEDNLELIGEFITNRFEPRKRKRALSEKEERLLIMFYKNCEDTNKILTYFNRKFERNLNPDSLRAFMSRRGIKKGKKFSPRIIIEKEDENKIIKEYQEGKSSTHLARKYGFKGSKSILDILESNGIKRRTQDEINRMNIPYRDLSFKKMDSEFKAYYLGLLLTDGYLNKKDNLVGLQLVDFDCMRFLADQLKVTCMEIKEKNERAQKMYRVCIFGKELIVDLERFGMQERKSLDLRAPKIKSDEIAFLPMLIRGVIDGDGWIQEDGKEFFICSASEEFISWCKESLESFGMKELRLSFVDNGYNGMFYLRTARKENIRILKKSVYNKPYGMSRKYNRLHKEAENVQRL